MDTYPEVIVIGKVSSPLAGNYNSKQSIFSPALAPKSPVLIQMCTDALEWGYNGGAQTDENLRLVANYLLWLCGKFGLEARNIIGIGGSSVVPIVPGSLRPSRIDFVVSGSSILPTGSSGGTFSSFIGYELDIIRGGIPQSTITTEPTYFTWTKATGLLFISPSLFVGEVISIIPV